MLTVGVVWVLALKSTVSEQEFPWETDIDVVMVGCRCDEETKRFMEKIVSSLIRKGVRRLHVVVPEGCFESCGVKLAGLLAQEFLNLSVIVDEGKLQRGREKRIVISLEEQRPQVLEGGELLDE